MIDQKVSRLTLWILNVLEPANRLYTPDACYSIESLRLIDEGRDAVAYLDAVRWTFGNGVEAIDINQIIKAVEAIKLYLIEIDLSEESNAYLTYSLQATHSKAMYATEATLPLLKKNKKSLTPTMALALQTHFAINYTLLYLNSKFKYALEDIKFFNDGFDETFEMTDNAIFENKAFNENEFTNICRSLVKRARMLDAKSEAVEDLSACEALIDDFEVLSIIGKN